jgi:hypothetical protein
MVLTLLPALLVELWREQHPDGVEQLALDSSIRRTRNSFTLSELALVSPGR